MKFILFCVTLDLSDNLTETCIVKSSVACVSAIVQVKFQQETFRYFVSTTAYVGWLHLPWDQPNTSV